MRSARRWRGYYEIQQGWRTQIGEIANVRLDKWKSSSDRMGFRSRSGAPIRRCTAELVCAMAQPSKGPAPQSLLEGGVDGAEGEASRRKEVALSTRAAPRSPVRRARERVGPKARVRCAGLRILGGPQAYQGGVI